MSQSEPAKFEIEKIEKCALNLYDVQIKITVPQIEESLVLTLRVEAASFASAPHQVTHRLQEIIRSASVGFGHFAQAVLDGV